MISAMTAATDTPTIAPVLRANAFLFSAALVLRVPSVTTVLSVVMVVVPPLGITEVNVLVVMNVVSEDGCTPPMLEETGRLTRVEVAVGRALVSENGGEVDDIVVNEGSGEAGAL